jgi:hypothetical protein
LKNTKQANCGSRNSKMPKTQSTIFIPDLG